MPSLFSNSLWAQRTNILRLRYFICILAGLGPCPGPVYFVGFKTGEVGEGWGSRRLAGDSFMDIHCRMSLEREIWDGGVRPRLAGCWWFRLLLKERDVLNLGAGGVVAKAANRFFTGHGVLFQSPCGLGVGSVLSGCRHLNFQTILVIVAQNGIHRHSNRRFRS